MWTRRDAPRELDIAIGLSTIRRPTGVEHVPDTVRALRDRGVAASARSIPLIVVNANDPPEAHETAHRLAALGEAPPLAAPVVLDAGPAATPPADGLPDWARWGYQLCHDYARLLRVLSATGREFLLALDDDLVPAADYLERIRQDVVPRFVRVGDLFCVALFSVDLSADYNSSTVAVLYRNGPDLHRFAAYVEAHAARNPVDLLLQEFCRERTCRAYVHVPSLFQHIGAASSSGRTVYRDATHLRSSPTFRDRPGALGLEPRHWFRDAKILAFRLRWRLRYIAGR